MDLNHKQQDKYAPNQFHVYIEIGGQKIRDTDYLEVDNVVRDISYVRHESTKYSYLYAGQFRFEQMLSLPYWDFLFLKGNLHAKEIENIQDGCLLFIALFFVEIFDAEGTSYIYSKQLQDKLDNALNLFQPTTDKQKAAVDKIKFLRKHIANDGLFHRLKPDNEQLEIEKTITEHCIWIYKEFVENYFWETAKAFETNRRNTTTITEQLIKRGNNNQPEKP